MHLRNYLRYLMTAEKNLAEGFHKVGEGHMKKVDIFHTTDVLAEQCEAHAEKLEPFCEKYGKEQTTEPHHLYHELFGETRRGGLGLLRDLQDLYLMAQACDIAWTMVGQAAPRVRATRSFWRSLTPARARRPPRSSGPGRA